jgi:hypothetical protein
MQRVSVYEALGKRVLFLGSVTGLVRSEWAFWDDI